MKIEVLPLFNILNSIANFASIAIGDGLVIALDYAEIGLR